jgi:predicted small lipoprotein YifL
MNRTLKTAVSLPVLAAALLALGACGKLGNLDRPAPLFSSKQRSQEAAERAAANRAKGEATADQSATSQTNGDYTQDRDGAKDPNLAPLRSSPPPGAPPSPFDSRPIGGVLPDPYADPNTTPR